MISTLTGWWNWFMMYVAPVIVTSLLPSLITAATQFPKTKGFVPALQKILHVLSWLTHKDESGTLKIPFDPRMKAPADVALRASSLLPIVLLPALLVALASCGWVQKHPKVATAINCAATDLAKTAPQLLSDAMQALDGGTPDWGALARLEATYGVNAVICVVEALTGGAPSAQMATMDNRARAKIYRNGGAYLHAKGRL